MGLSMGGENGRMATFWLVTSEYDESFWKSSPRRYFDVILSSGVYDRLGLCCACSLKFKVQLWVMHSNKMHLLIQIKCICSLWHLFVGQNFPATESFTIHNYVVLELQNSNIAPQILSRYLKRWLSYSCLNVYRGRRCIIWYISGPVWATALYKHSFTPS